MDDTSHFEAELTCPSCGVTGEHSLLYTGRLLARTRCLSCGHVEVHEQQTFQHDYLADLGQRIRTKPVRMARRLRRRPVRFLLSVPGAVLRKPAQLVREVTEVFRGG